MDRERFNSENLVKNRPDRPPVTEVIMTGGLGVDPADRLVVRVKESLTAPRVVRGHTIGGGTSDEALRRARRHLGRSS